jgi:hypothetical protein
MSRNTVVVLIYHRQQISDANEAYRVRDRHLRHKPQEIHSIVPCSSEW